MHKFNRQLTRFLIVSLCYFYLPMQPAQAELVPTYAIAAVNESDSARQTLARYLQREEVRAGLEQYGVNPAAAKARVDALSDDEVATVAGKINALPAGGEFIGAVVFIFLVLLVTDILGFTKIFNFTRSAKK
jgi:hypothetical protein